MYHINIEMRRFDITNFLLPSGPFGAEFKGPLLSPTRAIVNVIGFSFVFVVPALYWAIFRFRNAFDSALMGEILNYYVVIIIYHLF